MSAQCLFVADYHCNAKDYLFESLHSCFRQAVTNLAITNLGSMLIVFSSPTIKRWASASKLQRQHNLFSKNVMRPETCSPCGKKIRFGNRAYKCKGKTLTPM